MDLFSVLTERAELEPPATIEDLLTAERQLGRTLPGDLRSILLRTNGVSSAIGSFCLLLWSAAQIGALTEDYRISRYMPGCIMIGSDGGARCFLLDYRNAEVAPPVLAVGYGDIGFESAHRVAGSVTELIERISASGGQIDLDVDLPA